MLLKSIPYLVEKIWAGTHLSDIKDAHGQNIGESLEVSTIEGQNSKVNNFELSDYLKGNLSYLVKFISTSEHLSIQVHPDDDYAMKNQQSSGKTECWYIIDSSEGAGVYLGLKDGVNRKDFENAVHSKVDISHLLNFYPVAKGDFFYVPAGSIHAIGKGVTLLEAQQASGVTYRVWDWDRLDKKGKARELHLKDSFNVINFDPMANMKSFFRVQNILLDSCVNRRVHLVSHDTFNLDFYHLEGELELNSQDYKNPTSVIITDGHVILKEKKQQINVNPFETYLWLDQKSDVSIKSKSAKVFLVY